MFYLCTRLTAIRSESLAQQVEHNTFNVGVLGSSPKRITKESESYTKVTLFFYALNAPVYVVQLNRELNQEWIFRISFPKYSAQRKFLVVKF